MTQPSESRTVETDALEAWTRDNFRQQPPERLTRKMDEYLVLMTDLAKSLETRLAAQTAAREAAESLLREWLNTELDSMDEEFEPWVASFTERIEALLPPAPASREGRS